MPQPQKPLRAPGTCAVLQTTICKITDPTPKPPQGCPEAPQFFFVKHSP